MAQDEIGALPTKKEPKSKNIPPDMRQEGCSGHSVKPRESHHMMLRPGIFFQCIIVSNDLHTALSS
ncbi:hypothetical protein, partial [uncultured Bilophila sp.]|uniref:hypothetical protein n=1 Tax=uncultured Bilophila sp. TaxID=529385 RepID=UPI00259A3A44